MIGCNSFRFQRLQVCTSTASSLMKKRYVSLCRCLVWGGGGGAEQHPSPVCLASDSEGWSAIKGGVSRPALRRPLSGHTPAKGVINNTLLVSLKLSLAAAAAAGLRCTPISHTQSKGQGIKPLHYH